MALFYFNVAFSLFLACSYLQTSFGPGLGYVFIRIQGEFGPDLEGLFTTVVNTYLFVFIETFFV